jgi:hypothetical protein
LYPIRFLVHGRLKIQIMIKADPAAGLGLEHFLCASLTPPKQTTRTGD